jgi:hypothetical protein
MSFLDNILEFFDIKLDDVVNENECDIKNDIEEECVEKELDISNELIEECTVQRCASEELYNMEDDKKLLEECILFGSASPDCLERLLKKKEYDVILSVIIDSNDKIFQKKYILYILAWCCSVKTHELVTLPTGWEIEENIYTKDFKDDCFKLVLDICTFPPQLFMFIDYYETINKKLYNTTGWNSCMKRTINKWYNNKPIDKLMQYITMYPCGNGWTHRDVLRLSHIKNHDINYNNIYKYIVRGEYVLFKELTLSEKVYKIKRNMNGITMDEAIKYNNQIDIENSKPEHPLVYLLAFEKLKKTTDIKKVVEYIKKYNFCIKQIPLCWLNTFDVINALLPNMTLIDILRHLNKIHQAGIFNVYFSLSTVLDKFNEDSTLHPLQISIITHKYKRCGNKRIVKAIDDLYQRQIKIFKDIKHK